MRSILQPASCTKPKTRRPAASTSSCPNQYGNLAAGGTLYALKVVGQTDFSFVRLPVSAVGTTWDTEWVQVTDVEAVNGRAYNSALGRAAFARPEGAYYDSGKIFWTCTSGGTAGQGQVFVYDPRRETLTLLFQSTGAGIGSTECNNPDNIAVSPRGGVVLCEDGGNNIQRLRGLTQSGTTFIFAENNINLSAANVAQADAALKANGALITHFPPGNCRGIEWAGACFHERWMFVNNRRDAGITFAITGPWDNGMLSTPDSRGQRCAAGRGSRQPMCAFPVRHPTTKFLRELQHGSQRLDGRSSTSARCEPGIVSWSARSTIDSLEPDRSVQLSRATRRATA